MGGTGARGEPRRQTQPGLVGGAHDRGGGAQGGGDDLEVRGHEIEDLGAHRLAQRPPPHLAGAGQAAGDDDALGVQDGDDGGDRLAQGHSGLAVDAPGDGVPGVGEPLDLLGAGDAGAGGLAVAAGDLGPGRDGLQVAGASAGAGLGARRAGGHVPHLPGQEAGAVVDAAVQDDRSADARAHGDHEDAGRAGAGADPGLACGVGVDVVVDVHGHALRRSARGQEPSGHCGGDVGAGPVGDGVGGRDDHASARVDDTRRADPDRRRRRERPGRRAGAGGDDAGHQGGDGVQHGPRPFARRGGSLQHGTEQGAVSGHEGGCNLRAAQVDADDRGRGPGLLDRGRGDRCRHLRPDPARARSPRSCPWSRPGAP